MNSLHLFPKQSLYITQTVYIKTISRWLAKEGHFCQTEKGEIKDKVTVKEDEGGRKKKKNKQCLTEHDPKIKHGKVCGEIDKIEKV